MDIGEIRRTQARWLLGSLSPEALVELGLEPLDAEQAKLVVAKTWAGKIVSGEIHPYDGARAISRECCDLMGSRSREAIGYHPQAAAAARREIEQFLRAAP